MHYSIQVTMYTILIFFDNKDTAKIVRRENHLKGKIMNIAVKIYFGGSASNRHGQEVRGTLRCRKSTAVDN